MSVVLADDSDCFIRISGIWDCCLLLICFVLVVFFLVLTFFLIVCSCFVLDYINFGKLRQCRSDNAFHGYGEVCNFVYCLLMRTHKLSDLPGIYERESYMDTSKLSAFGVIAVEEFLMDCDFGRDLAATKTGEMREFRVKCRECIDRFVFLILDNVTVTSGISRGMYSFCPKIVLEGDEQHVFELFNSLCELYAPYSAVARKNIARQFSPLCLSKMPTTTAATQRFNRIAQHSQLPV